MVGALKLINVRSTQESVKVGVNIFEIEPGSERRKNYAMGGGVGK
jgi:hypothetical protein